MKTPELILKPINKARLKKGLKKESNEHTQICFLSYSECIRELGDTMANNEKQKLSRFFVPVNPQRQHEKGSSSLMRSLGSSSHEQKDKSLNKSRQEIFSHHFVSEVLQLSSKSHIASNTLNLNLVSDENDDMDDDEFTHQEKESLKNAFRYICRLIFKQAHKYSERMGILESLGKESKGEKLEEKHSVKKSRSISRSSMSVARVSLSDLNLAGEAQLISGERYFKQYLQRLSPTHRPLLLNYMIWFLKTKYLRYINKCNNENKGKRKQMKKNLYIKFKNTTMLPYLEALLVEGAENYQFS